jgi:two-component system, NarL family, nitrate/nitrite response regulator NarL
MKRRVAVILVGRNPIALEGLGHVLSEQGFEIAGSGTDISTLAQETKAEPSDEVTRLVLIDGLLDPPATIALEIVAEKFPGARMVVLADNFDFDVMVECFRGGAFAYIVKKISSPSLIASLHLVAMGEKVMPSNLAEVLPSHPNIGAIVPPSQSLASAGLSVREVQILACLVAGHPNKIISRQLGISEATVKVHVKAILRKVGVQNRTQAAIWAVGEKMTGFGGHTDMSTHP